MAFGNRRSKRGLAAVSKGELIIPANKNPFFFGNFAEGGTVDDRQRMYEELFDQDEIYTEDGLADEKKIKRGNRNSIFSRIPPFRLHEVLEFIKQLISFTIEICK